MTGMDRDGQGWTGTKVRAGAQGTSCHSPVTVPKACGNTGENQPSLSGSPPSVPAELGPPSPSRAGPGRGGRAWVHVRGSVSRGSSTGDQHQWGAQPAGGGRSNFHLGGCRGPHRPLELPTPHTRMCTRGWQWIKLWSRGFTRLMASFFRIISMLWPCHGQRATCSSDEDGCHVE